MERDQDPSVGARSRLLLALVLTLLGLLLSVASASVGPERLGSRGIAAFMAIINVVVLPVVFLGRRPEAGPTPVLSGTDVVGYTPGIFFGKSRGLAGQMFSQGAASRRIFFQAVFAF